MNKMYFGGDYNPEQWPEETWERDMLLLKGAGVDILTINVFAWATLQPSDNKYDFKQLDKIVDLAVKNNMNICMGTSTAAHPAWMAKRYPDVLRVDFEGRKRKYGQRHNSCPSSPTYRYYSEKLAHKLAERYRKVPNIVAWHVSNEINANCYCENCEKNFRLWLKDRYKNLDNLNKAWNTAFWSHKFYEWDEIVAPNILSEHNSFRDTAFQGITLDYRRFQSDITLENYKAEYRAIKKYFPNTPITTNFMTYFFDLDYKKWAPYLDFVSWDNYPTMDAPDYKTAMWHDVMRGLKGGQPFWLMEQTPGVVNWHEYCSLKRPGEMRLFSYEAVAHGSDTVMYFQMRRSIGASEKYHGAIIDHTGEKNNRVYRECEELGNELNSLGSTLLGARTNSRAAIIFDWDNWWNVTFAAGPTRHLDYVKEVLNYYRAFWELHIPVDMVGVEDDFSQYGVVVAPLMYMIKGDFADRAKAFTENGGTFLTTTFSGYVNENDLIIMGGYPGPLRDLLGVWVEETDVMTPNMKNSFTYREEEYPVSLICDLLHLEGATSLGGYTDDFYAGMPAVTVNNYKNGKAYYVAATSSADFYRSLISDICKEKGIPALAEAPMDVEVTIRSNQNGNFLFVLNHNRSERTVKIPVNSVDLLSGGSYSADAEITLPAMGVMILKLA